MDPDYQALNASNNLWSLHTTMIKVLLSYLHDFYLLIELVCTNNVVFVVERPSIMNLFLLQVALE